MMRSNLHDWDVSYHEAVRIQNSLKKKLVLAPLSKPVKIVAGADVAYDKESDSLFAAIVVLRLPSCEIVERVTVTGKTAFPYIPGLLSFREAPILVEAFERLTIRPDVLLCDGQGIAHPRGFGLASHLGVLLDIPTVGCAKSRLCGTHRAPGPRKGNRAPIRMDGATVGAVVRSRSGVKPIHVSVGHRIDLPGAICLVLRCCRGFRLPEPTRQAHIMVTAARQAARPESN